MVGKQKRIPRNFLQLIIGVCVLLIGIMEYVLSRGPEDTYLGRMISESAGSLPFRVHIYGIFGGVLPEFVHSFSFALITMSLFPQSSRKIRAMICLFWLVIEVFFEVGQYFGTQIAGLMSWIYPKTIFLDPLRNYFINGTYDNLDILAIWLGIISAFIISELFVKKGGKEDETQIFKQRRVNMLKTPKQGAILETGG